MHRQQLVYQCIHHIFEQRARKHPHATALIYEDTHLSYHDLNTKANRLAHYLRKRGVGPDVPVAICVERSLDLVVGILGILKAGGAYLPLDPIAPRQRLRFMLEDSRVPLLLTQQRLRDSLPAYQGEVVLLDESPALLDESDANPAVDLTPEHLAYITYTSGSTGEPKGSEIPHRSVLGFMFGVDYVRFDLAQTFLQYSSISWDALTLELWPALLYGARCVLFPGQIASIEEIGAMIERYKVDILWLTSSLFNAMIDTQPQVLSGVQQLMIGGEQLSVPHVRRALELLPETQIVNGYGPSECTVFTCCYPIPNPLPDSLEMIPIGRPIGDRRVYLLNEHLSRVPLGVPGELYIGGPALARGYLNRPELTAERFVPNPFSEPGSGNRSRENTRDRGLGIGNWGEPRRVTSTPPDPRPLATDTRLYKTGDLTRYLPSGMIQFLGRVDRQVKIRGFRIELDEIEAALRRHQDVREVVVIAREDLPGDKRLVAYIVQRSVVWDLGPGEQPPDPGSLIPELRRFLHEHLPDYMIPAAFVVLDRLPQTSTGKLDRRALPPPERVRPELERSFVAPRTPVEQTLSRIWAQMLGIDQVGIDDNFFELGGDSILSIQIVARARQVGLQLSPKLIFQHQTIAELAAVVGAAPAGAEAQGLVIGPVGLTPIQRWFFKQNFPEPHHWNQSRLLEIRRTVNPALLEQALHHVVSHHDALRMRFVHEGGDWQQITMGADLPAPFTHLDLSALAEDDQARTIEAVAATTQARFDLAAGPLVRAVYFDLGPQRPGRLLIVIHHLVIDTTSWWFVLEDLQTAYLQLSSGQAVALPPKTTSFQHWSQRLTEYAQSLTPLTELAYWQTLRSCQPTVLPLDRHEGEHTEAAADAILVMLDADETEVLLRDIPRIYGTQINDVLLAALVQIFSAWTGSTGLLIDLESHGREDLFEDVDLSRTAGWFTTVFPAFLDLQAASDTDDAVKHIQEQLRRIPRHGIGYGVLRYLSMDAQIIEQMQALPQPEVSFNYLGQFDRMMPRSTLFAMAGESQGLVRAPRAHRPYLLEINGFVMNGRFQSGWKYSPALHRRETIMALAQNFMSMLRTIIDRGR